MNGGVIAQIAIAVFGVMAIALSQVESERLRRWACIFGLIGQPFWFYATFTSEQWGMFALCFLYTWAWGLGLYTHWVKGWIMREPPTLWCPKHGAWASAVTSCPLCRKP